VKSLLHATHTPKYGAHSAFRRLARILMMLMLVLSSTLVRSSYAQTTTILGSLGSAAFGSEIVVLPNGNIVITDPRYSEAGQDSIGAAYLYDGATMSVVSVLKGSHPNDFIGSDVIALANGNYLLVSYAWNGGMGAVTWGSATAGVSGVVSAANSLINLKPADYYPPHGVVALTNGNYVVYNAAWGDGVTTQLGAVTWGNGATGTVGEVSALNSLVGTTANDAVGVDVVPLANGNYGVSSPFWDNLPNWDVGAVTWANGATGMTGQVSASNSLTGVSSGDSVGQVTPLVNGNYVVSSSNWSNGATASVGAVTLVNGATGATGPVSAANSLIGQTAGDRIGSAVTPLVNGNYVVSSSSWDNGPTVDASAATWVHGVAGLIGTISPANSLVGTVSSAGPWSVTGLTNGNYVVSNPYWRNPSSQASNAGAVTWANGATGIAGTVSAANSLVGTSSSDYIGITITPLTNGNYVVSSPTWANTAGVRVGTASWADGTTGKAGAVSAANSLVGSTADDEVGRSVTALSNGNYVVSSARWSNGATPHVGAATWADGTTGLAGPVSAANSLIGTAPEDQVGWEVSALSNGNYTVRSQFWDNGAAADVGAITLADGATGLVGVVSAANSLVGNVAGDLKPFSPFVPSSARAFPDGSAALISPEWDAGNLIDAGAVTWVDGVSPLSGTLTTANSIFGWHSTPFPGATPPPNGAPTVVAFDPVQTRMLVGSPLGNQVVLFDIPIRLRFQAAILSLPMGELNQPYLHQIGVFGRGPFSFSIVPSPGAAQTTSGLPAGIALSSDGVLSGAPSQLGQFTFTVQVTDSTQQVATQELVMFVAEEIYPSYLPTVAR
jgi:Repeat of unknown function (DUF5650)